jgi:hypothetical protein
MMNKTYNAWLSPNGKFVVCGHGDHDEPETVKRMGVRSTVDAEANGWIRITGNTPIIGRGEILPKSQIDAILDLHNVTDNAELRQQLDDVLVIQLARKEGLL